MGLLLMAVLTYVGIIAAVGMVSAAFESGGVLGILALFGALLFGGFIAAACDKKK